jgi:hypothetical protein
MTELQASRTLVKSPPELWAECSDAASLARHLDGFGEIRITRLEPETAVAWEGERARGTVRIEPAGWGTKVILTAVQEGTQAVADAPPEPELPVRAAPPEPGAPTGEAPAAQSAPPEPEPELAMADALSETEPPLPVRKRRFARLRAFWRGEPLPAPEPSSEVPPVEEPPAEDPPLAAAIEAPLAEPEIAPPAVSETEAALTAALDSLGQAHHRPYSRA